jgi:hypothetical protein
MSKELYQRKESFSPYKVIDNDEWIRWGIIMLGLTAKRYLFPVLRLFILVFATFSWLTGCQGGKMTRDTKQRPSEAIPLHYDAAGKFRIAQFTDIHWTGSEPEQCAAAERVISHVLETERPHLAVLTGDIVIAPQEAGWKAVMALFAEAHVPVAVALGNHDDEAEWTREQIFRYLSTLPGFVGSRGPADLSGVGNYILEIHHSKTIPFTSSSPDAAPSGISANVVSYSSSAESSLAKISSVSATAIPATKLPGNSSPPAVVSAVPAHALPAALLYFFDSQAYAADTAASYYDWIKFYQIAWYREQSRHTTARNRGIPLPALAFFHIPLPEYADVMARGEFLGEAREEVCAPKINTGLLASFVEMKDVMGTFVGHDHVNNFIGIHKGVALAYGQKTGFSSYGDLDKGARIIELQEGKREFTTWIRTEKGTSLFYQFPAQP